MKILTLHCDYITFQANKKAFKDAPELTDAEKKSHTVKECLVVLTSIEHGDSQKELDAMLASVKKTAGEVKAKNIVLYPYAHLSSHLAKPTVAIDMLKKAEQALEEDYAVTRAPFGYYKTFELKCKGHPLSELSKTFGEQTQTTVKKSAPSAAHSSGKFILDRRNLPAHDHRILGEDLGFFTFSEEVGPGLPLWLPAGESLRHTLIEYMRGVEEKYGYKYVATPHITKGELYEKTGHLPYYAESMYAPIDIEGQPYYLKPMNCPHHHMIYSKIVKSYRDLPLRLAEAGTLYRNELSGVTYGLIRVRGMTMNDAHIYVRPDQVKDEFISVLKMFEEVYKRIGIRDYWFRLSLPDFKANPDKYTGDPKEWEHASVEIRKAMKEWGHKFIEVAGEAAFYGPKIDVQIKNVHGKEETIATSQLDIVIPRRLGLDYTDEEGKEQTPFVIHRAIIGTFDRFTGFLLEQTEGKLPLWLSPRQVRIINFTDRNAKAAQKCYNELKEALPGIRVDLDLRTETVQAKVRDAEMLKINYLVVIGDKEEENKTLAVRPRGAKPSFGVKPATFIANLKKELSN